MARKVFHIAPLRDIEKGERGGKKVEGLCGKKFYPMRNMDAATPTCTACSRAAMRLLSPSDAYYAWGGK